MKYIAIILGMILISLLATACSPPSEVAPMGYWELQKGWSVVQSPITGKYYEVLKLDAGVAGYMSMSEVTQAEYDRYIEAKEKE